jgi:hypothetical protein
VPDQHDPRAIGGLIPAHPLRLSARFTPALPPGCTILYNILKYNALNILARILQLGESVQQYRPRRHRNQKPKRKRGMAHRKSSARSKGRKGRGLTLATMVLSGWLLAGLSMVISIGMILPV